MPKISIVIPVYNVEKYLAECLDSCINQTLSDIEIICVDDCSTDSSLKILQEYAGRDSRIKILRHEMNTRQGGARNDGVQIAGGEYVWFVDSDDFIDQNSCQLLYDSAKKNDVDVLMFEGKSFYDGSDGRKFIEDDFYNDFPKNCNISLKKFTKPFSNVTVVPWCYIVRTSLLRNCRFRTGVLYEDTDFTPILLHSADSVRSISFTPYNRRLWDGSSTQSEMTEKKLLDKIAVVYALQDFIRKNKVSRRSYLYRFYKDHKKFVCYEILRNEDLMDRNNEFYRKNMRFTRFKVFLRKLINR